MERQRKGPDKKAKSSFCFLGFYERKNNFFLSKRRVGLLDLLQLLNLKKKAWRLKSQFLFFLQLVHLLFHFWTIFRWYVLTDISLVSHLLFAPDSPEGKKKKREGCSARVGGIETHKAKDQCKKKKTKLTVRESRWTMPVIYHTKSKHRHRYAHTIKAEGRNCFLSHFSIQFDSFGLFYQGCDSTESKNQQLKLGVKLYTALTQHLLFHHTWQLCNQKLLSFIPFVFGLC